MCETSIYQQLLINYMSIVILMTVSRYLIGAKIIPYTSFRWYEVSKNGTTF